MSVVQIYGLNEGNHCGYCNGNGSNSYGLNCSKMKPSDYEALMLRGWRRCGSYYYKPHIASSCCKLNTIRLDAKRYVPNKKQRKVASKFEAFLSGKKHKEIDKAAKREETKATLNSLIPQTVSTAVEIAATILCSEFGIEPTPAFCKVHRNTKDKEARFGTYTCSTPLILCAAAKKAGADITPKALAEKMMPLLSEHLQGMTCSVSEIGHVNITDPSAVQVEISHKPPEEVKEPPKKVYAMTIVDAVFDEEAYQLYRKYQIAVHHDPPSKINRDGYTRFLCDSSLIKDKPLPNGPGIGYGSYHFHHRIDGKLFAVGVCDIMPTGLSSVYFFYDTDLQFLTVGTLGAVKELEWINQCSNETFRYYYMGFYIDTCVKMNYKGEYAPSELLCPVTYHWVPLAACMQTKEQHKFMRLAQCTPETADLPVSDDMNVESLQSPQQFIADTAMIVLRGKLMKMQALPDSVKMRIIFYLLDAFPNIGKMMMGRLLFAF